MSKTSSEVKNRYNSIHYDRITLITDKGNKDKIKSKADSKGLSLNSYILSLIEKDMMKWSLKLPIHISKHNVK